MYIATSKDISPQIIDKRGWWKKHENKLPDWAKSCLLVQPSSAAAERAFSILSNCFSSKQEHSLQDYIEASVMLRYNLEPECLSS